MKRILIVTICMLVFILSASTFSMGAFTVNVTANPELSKTEIGGEINYTISFNEKIVAGNFDLEFNTELLEFVSSETTNLNIAMNNGKLSCVYVDISQNGTSDLKIKFKKKSSIGEPNIKFTNIKFRGKDKEISYTEKDIQIIIAKTEKEDVDNSNTSKKDDTSSNIPEKNTTITTPNTSTTRKDNTLTTKTKLPNTGMEKTTIIAISFIVVLLVVAGIMKKKEKYLKQIFKSGGIMIFVFILGANTIFINTSNATTTESSEEVDIKFYNETLIKNKKNSLIVFNKPERTHISKQEAITMSSVITDITNQTNSDSLLSNDNVKTGDNIKIDDEIYTVILSGDANGDGIVGDTDDIMCIIDDFLGKKTLENENRVAANLQNNDNILDVDDIMYMVNRYLGKSDVIISKTPSGYIQEVTEIGLSIDAWSLSMNYGNGYIIQTDILRDTTGANINYELGNGQPSFRVPCKKRSSLDYYVIIYQTNNQGIDYSKKIELKISCTFNVFGNITQCTCTVIEGNDLAGNLNKWVQNTSIMISL